MIGSSVYDLFNRNPEMKLDPSTPNVMIVNQAKKLSAIIADIKSAISGNKEVVNCVDCSESGDVSGEEPSGSGGRLNW